MEQYFPPKFKASSFHCPNCGAYAEQLWSAVEHHPQDHPNVEIKNLLVASCQNCKLRSYWIDQEMIYPITSVAPMPSADMPEDVKEDFNEARKVFMTSPRASAALLRLALQKLMPHLGEKGNNLSNDVASLVSKGLPETIQKTLDSVRVIGNNAVHPGQIDIKDDVGTALTLFNLVNLVVYVLITQPKENRHY